VADLATVFNEKCPYYRSVLVDPHPISVIDVVARPSFHGESDERGVKESPSGTNYIRGGERILIFRRQHSAGPTITVVFYTE
jgi:hypothetical protein